MSLNVVMQLQIYTVSTHIRTEIDILQHITENLCVVFNAQAAGINQSV